MCVGPKLKGSGAHRLIYYKLWDMNSCPTSQTSAPFCKSDISVLFDNMPTKRISSSLMAIPETVWQESEQWQQITTCPLPLWCNPDIVHSVTQCNHATWNNMVAFVRHYQAAPDGDKESVAKGHTPPSALWVGKSLIYFVQYKACVEI